MYTPDRNQLRNILIEEMGYAPGAADDYLDRWGPLHDSLAGIMTAWLEDRTVPDIEIEGVRLQKLMCDHRMSFLNALDSVNDLLVLPLGDLEREALRGFLSHPPVIR